jgi:hypothetical protein
MGGKSSRLNDRKALRFDLLRLPLDFHTFSGFTIIRTNSPGCLEHIEAIAREIEVGREIRVILNAKNADDTATFQITEAIVKRIEAEMAFSGEIKVTPLRETGAEAIVR